MPEKAYIAIDLKSFYASVECVERGLDPLTTNLVVADESSTTKTICLAATPAIKSYGVPGRARLFEVVQKVKEANLLRKGNAPKCKLEVNPMTQLNLRPPPPLPFPTSWPSPAWLSTWTTALVSTLSTFATSRRRTYTPTALMRCSWT